MNKPKKIDTETGSSDYTCGHCNCGPGGCVCNGYNQAVDDYEAWLPSKEEIDKIVSEYILQTNIQPVRYSVDRNNLVKAISKRLGGK